MTFCTSRRTRDRVLTALRDHGPQTADQLVETAATCEPTVRKALQELREAGEIHVGDYRAPFGRGVWSKVWAAGAGEDAPVPPGARVLRSRKTPLPAPPQQSDLLAHLRKQAAAGSPVPAWLVNMTVPDTV